MPDSTLPRWARTMGRALRASCGLLAALVGLGDLHQPSDILLDAAGPGLVGAWAVAAIVAGTVAAVAVLTHRWRWELVCAAVLATALATRAGAVWLTVDDGVRMGAAAGMTLAAALFLLRVFDLTVFAVKASAGPRRVRRLRLMGRT